MTTRKYNAIRKHSTLGPATFAALMNFMERELPLILNLLPAKRIAEVMQGLYDQHAAGILEGYSEAQ